tara:strand:- start:292 stop:660 length:369 start_codon:yes stop_codon:yes gene_type:complete
MGGSTSKPIKPIALRDLYTDLKSYNTLHGKRKTNLRDRLVVTVQKIQKMADDDVKKIKGDVRHDEALYRKWGTYWAKYRFDLERITQKKVNIEGKLLPLEVKKQYPYNPSKAKRMYDYFIIK